MEDWQKALWSGMALGQGTAQSAGPAGDAAYARPPTTGPQMAQDFLRWIDQASKRFRQQDLAGRYDMMSRAVSDAAGAQHMREFFGGKQLSGRPTPPSAEALMAQLEIAARREDENRKFFEDHRPTAMLPNMSTRPPEGSGLEFPAQPLEMLAPRVRPDAEYFNMKAGPDGPVGDDMKVPMSILAAKLRKEAGGGPASAPELTVEQLAAIKQRALMEQKLRELSAGQGFQQ